MPRVSVLKFLLGLVATIMGAGLALVTPAAAQERAYVLGPNDTITVQVYGQPEAGVTTRIKPDGTIVMPLIGVVKAEGETVLGLADVVKRRFVSGGFLKSPFVNVEINAYVSKTVNVAGKVTQPGVYPLDKDYRVLEMLLKAGWVKDQGATYVFLRNAGTGTEVRLETEALVRGAGGQDPLLSPGDTLYVPDADVFYVYGQIARPGAFPIVKGLTLRQALAISGGVTAAGSVRKVALIRGDGKEVDAKLDEPVQSNDIYIVKERLF